MDKKLSVQKYKMRLINDLFISKGYLPYTIQNMNQRDVLL